MASTSARVNVGIDEQFAGRAEGIVARRENLDPVGAVVNLFADGAAGVIGAGDGFVAAGNGDSREADGGNDGADSFGRNLQARAGEIAAIDGVAHVHVAVAFAMGAEVAHGGESGAQIGLRFFQRRGASRLRSRWSRARPPGERVVNVRMAVDQAGQDRGLAEVNHLGSGGNLDAVGGTHVGDAVAIDEDDLIDQIGARLGVEEPARPNSDGWRILGLTETLVATARKVPRESRGR